MIFSSAQLGGFAQSTKRLRFIAAVLFCALLSASQRKASCRDNRTLRRPRATWRAQNQPGSFLPQILPVPVCGHPERPERNENGYPDPKLPSKVVATTHVRACCLFPVNRDRLGREQVRSDLRVAWLVCSCGSGGVFVNEVNGGAEMSEASLGKLCDGQQQRDAIHVAVIPAQAAQMLCPAQRVGRLADGRYGMSLDRVVGVVDPYLIRAVQPDEWFWLCLLPGTLAGMRHHWTHPAFDGGTTGTDDGVKAKQHAAASKVEAEVWLRAQCEPLGCDFCDLVSPDSDLVCGQYILNEMNESARNHWYEIMDDFWEFRRIYTGHDVAEDMRGGFTCSC